MRRDADNVPLLVASLLSNEILIHHEWTRREREWEKGRERGRERGGREEGEEGEKGEIHEYNIPHT